MDGEEKAFVVGVVVIVIAVMLLVGVIVLEGRIF